MSASRTARALARDELTRMIKEEAHRQLQASGPSALSLRAVARELGMVSSAVYRYFPSRDDLITALIIDGYNDLGAHVERAEAAVRDRDDMVTRFLATCRAVREWAHAHPVEYGLLYGTPVPGYAAPDDTIGPASRVTAVLATLLRDAQAVGALRADAKPVPARVRRDLSRVRTFIPGVPDDGLVRGLMAWTYLFGAVSFELFGHRHNVVDDFDAFFEHEMNRIAGFVGLEGAA